MDSWNVRMKLLVASLAWRIGSLQQEKGAVILITGSQRSGTTWLLELLETLPGTRRVWEPFGWDIPQPSDPKRLEKAIQTNVGLGQRPYLPVGTNHPELESFLNALLSGLNRDPLAVPTRLDSRWEMLKRLVVPTRTVIKFVRAQRLMPWLLHRFPVKTILLMRHPLAVVASQLRLLGHDWIREEHPIVSKELAAEYPELAEYAVRLPHLEEKLAATWCFDSLIPLQKWTYCRNALLVPYETLVRDPENELQRMEQHLGIQFPEATLQRIRYPSSTTMTDSNVIAGKDPLRTWESRLSPEEVQRILNVVGRFGIDIYSDEDPYIDLQRLTEFTVTR